MKVVHFSDTHAGSWLDHWTGFFDKRLLGTLNFNTRRRHLHLQERLSSFSERMLEEKPDLLICTGDLTSVGQPSEFEEALKLLEPLRNSSIPLVYVPGNHDCYVKNKTCRNAMIHAVEWLNNKSELTFDTLPAVRTFGEVDILAVNECFPTSPASSCGSMSKEVVSFIENQLARGKQRPVILAGHYPILEPFSFTRARRRLWGQKRVAELLKQGEIDISLCGHIHHSFEELDDSGRGETCAGSLTKHGCYTVIEYHKETNSFSHHRKIIT